jgi:hypothetical protein
MLFIWELGDHLAQASSSEVGTLDEREKIVNFVLSSAKSLANE